MSKKWKNGLKTTYSCIVELNPNNFQTKHCRTSQQSPQPTKGKLKKMSNTLGVGSSNLMHTSLFSRISINYTVYSTYNEREIKKNQTCDAVRLGF